MADPRIIARVHASVLEVDANAWNALLAQEQHATPFMRHEYLAALERSGSATPRTGWTARFISLWDGESLIGACPLYLKSHSYGEYVFDWAWASAYEQHGVPYYPKAVIAVPFTPVPGARLLARDATARTLLVEAARQYCLEQDISSLHILFASEQDQKASAQAELMHRHTVQFHWQNRRSAMAEPEAADLAASKYVSFDDFLAQLTQEKRKKIRQERRRVTEAGVTFRWSRGRDISTADWDFFYRCYERTYLEHGNPPYLTRAFFTEMEQHLPEAWVLFVAERNGRPIASSLIAVSALSTGGRTQKYSKDASPSQAEDAIAYGRYWGALERVDCLHFEACYYQPIAWCIEHGISRFEGGAQGEHKMARALLPVQASSTHWLAHPAFADAVERFLDREGEGVEQYLQLLQQRSPLRSNKAPIQPDPEA